MKTFETTLSIRATPETVWAILTDASRWTEWNTTVDKIEGTIALGNKVTVYAKISPGRAFPVKVAVLDAPKRMVWSGGMPLGLFKGERTYTLTPKDGGVEFDMREVYTGLMAGMITKSIPDLTPAFVEFGEALKKKAEAGH